jgi:hypothetical protein
MQKPASRQERMLPCACVRLIGNTIFRFWKFLATSRPAVPRRKCGGRFRRAATRQRWHRTTAAGEFPRSVSKVPPRGRLTIAPEYIERLPGGDGSPRHLAVRRRYLGLKLPLKAATYPRALSPFFEKRCSRFAVIRCSVAHYGNAASTCGKKPQFSCQRRCRRNIRLRSFLFCFSLAKCGVSGATPFQSEPHAKVMPALNGAQEVNVPVTDAAQPQWATSRRPECGSTTAALGPGGGEQTPRTIYCAW